MFSEDIHSLTKAHVAANINNEKLCEFIAHITANVNNE
jgi:hypothetical protein